MILGLSFPVDGNESSASDVADFESWVNGEG